MPSTTVHMPANIVAAADPHKLALSVRASCLLFEDESDHPHLYRVVDETVIQAAYDYCEQNQLRTARLLGISRNIVRDRLLRYGLLKSQKDRS